MSYFNWTIVSPTSEFYLNADGKLEDKEYSYSENLFKRIQRKKLWLRNPKFESTPKETLDKIQNELDEGKLVLVTPWDEKPKK
jgi:hypothetical protein